MKRLVLVALLILSGCDEQTTANKTVGSTKNLVVSGQKSELDKILNWDFLANSDSSIFLTEEFSSKVDTAKVQSVTKAKNIVSSSVKKQEIINKANVKNIVAKTDEITTTQSAVVSNATTSPNTQTNQNMAQLNLLGGLNAKSAFTAVLDSSVETDGKSFEEEDKTVNSTNWLMFTYRMNSDYSLRAWFSFEKDLYDTYEDRLNDTRLILIKSPLKLTNKMILIPTLAAVLPTSEDSARRQEKIAGVELSGIFVYNASDLLSFTYLPRAVKNFHQFDTSRDDKVNIEYRVLQIASANYMLTDRFSTSASFIYINDWAYTGTQRDPSYITSFDLSYMFSPKVITTIGMNTGGSIAERQVGPDENIQLFDSNSTSYFARVRLQY